VIYAGAVERVLASDPAVAEAYVVGRPSETTGEAVHAFIVSATGLSPDPDLLCELVASRLGPNATPRSITVIPGVPVLPSGKPDKSALR
jgi:fatty-acyl-CoA synthase